MLMLAPVRARLDGHPTLSKRVYGAARLGQLTESGGFAQVAPAAFVLPSGLRGGTPDAATGMFRQPLDRIVGVVLIVRNANDPSGSKGIVELEPLIEDVIELLAGWGPEAAFGVLALARGELVSIASGTITYQLDFTIEDQLRIARP